MYQLLHIDVNNIEQECADYPADYAFVSGEYDDARQKFDSYKNVLSTTRSEIAKKVRLNPTSYGIEGRATENSINAVVDTHPDYLRCYEEYERLTKDDKSLVEFLLTSPFLGADLPIERDKSLPRDIEIEP